MGSPLKTIPLEAPETSGLAQHSTDGINAAWNDASHKDWDEFCAASPFAAYQQCYAYGEVLETIGASLHRAQLFVDGQWVGAAQVQIRKVFGLFTAALIVRGPVWAPGEISASTKAAAIEVLRKTLPVTGAQGLVVTPDSEDDNGLRALGYKRVISGYHTVMLDLTPDEETLRAALNGKWRNRLNTAEKADIVVSPLGKRPEKYAWLIAKEEAQQNISGYRTLPSVITQHYHQFGGKGAVVGFAAQEGADRLGGMLFLRHGDNATYHIGWASDVGKKTNVHNLLLWRAMLGLKKAGVRNLDLGGVNTDLNPGIARFKLGAGGGVRSLSGSWSKGPRWPFQR